MKKIKLDQTDWTKVGALSKREKDIGKFWVAFYTFVLDKAGVSQRERELFKNLGKRINPTAFVVNERFEEKLRKLKSNVNPLAFMNSSPSNILREGEAVGEDEVLIREDCYS